MPKNPFDGFHWSSRDWLSSRAKALMTVEQQGAYRNLLDHAWVADPPCFLPADDASLAALSGLGDRWAESGPIIRQWFVEKRGCLVNERQLKTFRAAMSLRAEKKKGGIKGGRKSAELREERRKDTLRTPTSSVQAESNPFSSSSSSSLSEKKKEEDSVPSERREPSAPVMVSSRDYVFTVGHALLVEAGALEASSKSLLAKLCGQFGEDVVAGVIERAATEKPGEPRSWITKQLMTLGGNGRGGHERRGKHPAGAGAITPETGRDGDLWEREERAAEAVRVARGY